MDAAPASLGKGVGMYKVLMKYPDGTEELDDEVFTSESEANEYGLTCCSDYVQGGEVLHLSNPGDYPADGHDEVDFEVVDA